MPSGPLQVAIVLMVGAGFLPWLFTPGIYSFGIDIPAMFLWDQAAASGVFTLGVLLFSLAALALLGSILRPLDGLRRLAGGMAVVAVAMMVFQWRVFLVGMGVEGLTLGFIGVGAYTAAAAGLTALLSPSN